MKIHTCKLCGTTSLDAKFYNGVTSRCAECHKSKVRSNRAEKSDYYRAYDAKRFAEDPRVAERHAKYRNTENGRASIRTAQRKWDQENADKKAAHTLLGNAVRRGKVQKPSICSSCGAGGRIHGHHHDYSQPLSVEWLCQRCHWDRHEQEWKEKRANT